MDELNRLIAVDKFAVYAGQEELRDLQDDLVVAGMKMHLIGGADKASEVDALRAMEQGVRLAAI